MARTRKRAPGTLRTLAIGAAIVAALFALNIYYPSLLALAELKTFDLRMYARGMRKPHGELGRWPWPRTVLAQLVEALKQYKVGVVGFDLVFSERDDIDLEREKIVGSLKDAGLPPD